jgi:cellobiose epimerase
MIMKIFIFLIIIVFLSTNADAAQSNPEEAPDTQQRMNQLKAEVFKNLTQNLLPYWSEYMVDHRNQGFYGRININNKVFPDDDKGGILNARILWTYSSAYRIIKDTAYLQLAVRAKDYIMAHFIDKENGGAFRSVKWDGKPSDTRKQIYTQSFFIYGLTEYYRATGDKNALKAAQDIFELVEKYALDRKDDGYFEVFTRDWHRTNDLLIGEKTAKDEKTMNTHLHLMEAYTNLYRVWPDKKVAERLEDLVKIFLDKITDPNSSHLICFMDRSWNRTSSTDSYGHDIEASWLLDEAAGLLGDRDLLRRSKETGMKIAVAAEEGLQPDGSMIYEKDASSGSRNPERSWWVQSETIVGYLNAFETTGNEKYLDHSINCWNYTRTHMVDSKAGGWFSSVSESGIAGNGDKGGFWVCPYHNGRMCMEIITRVSHDSDKQFHDKPENNFIETQ